MSTIIISYYVPLIGSAALTDALPLSPFTPNDLPIIIIINIYNYHNNTPLPSFSFLS